MVKVIIADTPEQTRQSILVYLRWCRDCADREAKSAITRRSIGQAEAAKAALGRAVLEIEAAALLPCKMTPSQLALLGGPFAQHGYKELAHPTFVEGLGTEVNFEIHEISYGEPGAIVAFAADENTARLISNLLDRKEALR